MKEPDDYISLIISWQDHYARYFSTVGIFSDSFAHLFQEEHFIMKRVLVSLQNV